MIYKRNKSYLFLKLEPLVTNQIDFCQYEKVLSQKNVSLTVFLNKMVLK